jgi:hypothetical protein
MTRPQSIFASNGIKIVVSPDRPKFQISPDCPLTDDFRIEMNAWCLSFFGTDNLVPDNQALDVDGVTYVNPRTFARLQALTEKTDKLPYSVGFGNPIGEWA